MRAHAIAFALSALMLSVPAGAQDDAERAREQFERAQSEYERGQYRTAAERFELAYGLHPHGGALFAAAVAWEKAGLKARAADAFAGALASGELPEDKRALAKERLDVLVLGVARVEVAPAGGARVTLAHVTRAPTPRVIHVEPGTYTLTLEWPDGRRWNHAVQAAARQVIPVRHAPETPPDPAPGVAERRPAPMPRTERTSSPPTLAWVAFGGAGVLGGTGTFLLMRGLRKRDDFEASGNQNEDDQRAAIELRTWATVSFVGAAVLAATGVVLVIDSAASETGRRKLPVRASANGAVLVF